MSGFFFGERLQFHEDVSCDCTKCGTRTYTNSAELDRDNVVYLVYRCKGCNHRWRRRFLEVTLIE